MTNEVIYNIRNNLRLLVNEMPSISKAASTLNINRQQLNKYLAGTSTPSVRTLSVISRHFSVTVDSLLLPPEEFQRTRTADTSNLILPDEVKATLSHITKQSEGAHEYLSQYCGMFFRISHMPYLPHKIMRALVQIYQKNGLTFAVTLELYPVVSLVNEHRSHVRRLHSVVQLVGDRIHFFGAPPPSHISMAILYPVDVPRFEFLRGEMTSVPDMASRRISWMPFVMQRCCSSRIQISDLRRCGVFDRDASAVEECVRQLLDCTLDSQAHG